MIRRIAIASFTMVLALGLTQTALAASDCCQFTPGCISAPTGKFDMVACTAATGTYVANAYCDEASELCVGPKTGDDPSGGICSESADKQVCVDLAGLNAPIPTVSEWGLAVMGLMVLAAGTVVMMRRRTAIA